MKAAIAVISLYVSINEHMDNCSYVYITMIWVNCQ